MNTAALATTSEQKYHGTLDMRIFVLASLIVGTTPVWANTDQNPIPQLTNDWRFSISPYLWGVGVSGSVTTNDGFVKSANMDFANVLSHLTMGAMVAGEAHYGHWGLGADVIYANLSDNPNHSHIGSPIKNLSVNELLSASISFNNTILTAAGMYTLVASDAFYMDGIVGIRGVWTNTGISASLNVSGTYDGKPVVDKSVRRNITAGSNIVDGVVGLKGKIKLGKSAWFVPYYGDIGSGGYSSKLTWQAMTGVGRAFDWGSLDLAYRALFYDMRTGSGQQKTTFSGFMLGGTIPF